MLRGNLFDPNLFKTGMFGRVQESLAIDWTGGITEISFRYSTGDLLSSDPDSRATVTVSQPGYVAAPHSFAGGVLPVRPIGVGTGTLSVTYVDPQNGLTTITRQITVLPQ